MSRLVPMVPQGPTAERAAALELDPALVAAMRAQLPTIAAVAVQAIVDEVPTYAGALHGPLRDTIQRAVQLALGTYLTIASRPDDAASPLGPALEAAYDLGRGEARGGRTMEALLAAYRVGARVSWRELAAVGVEAGMSARLLAEFAELVFAYIDELSAASVAGHTDELATTGRLQHRRLERLAAELLRGGSREDLARRAEAAAWTPPGSLTVVLLPAAHTHSALGLLDPRTLMATDDLPGAGASDDLAALLVPDAGGAARAALRDALVDREAVIGPARPWEAAAESYRRALRAHPIADVVVRARGRGEQRRRAPAYDTDEHLAELVLGADPAALADLRRRALAPLEGVSPASGEKLADTLRSWLLHQGRREAVAEDLFVHPQTVRYRMAQVRELFGEALERPESVLELTLALGVPPPRAG